MSSANSLLKKFDGITRLRGSISGAFQDSKRDLEEVQRVFAGDPAPRRGVLRGGRPSEVRLNAAGWAAHESARAVAGSSQQMLARRSTRGSCSSARPLGWCVPSLHAHRRNVVTGWVPRGVDPAERNVLVDGVPAYLRPALSNFLRENLARYSAATGSWLVKPDLLMQYDLVARTTPTMHSRLDGISWTGFIARLRDEELLDIADWVVHRSNRGVASDLENILEAASSAWTVGQRNSQPGLVRRMPKAVQDAVEVALHAGTAGSILAEAWAAAYGRTPDPEEAYEKSIKAVEQVAAEIVSPGNTRATLGTIVRDMKAQKDWALPLPAERADVVVTMAEALWTGQASRHGGNGYRRPTQAEAEVAVALAVALLQLFAGGLVERRK